MRRFVPDVMEWRTNKTHVHLEGLAMLYLKIIDN
jgi:hypothetical protein